MSAWRGRDVEWRSGWRAIRDTDGVVCAWQRVADEGDRKGCIAQFIPQAAASRPGSTQP